LAQGKSTTQHKELTTSSLCSSLTEVIYASFWLINILDVTQTVAPNSWLLYHPVFTIFIHCLSL